MTIPDQTPGLDVCQTIFVPVSITIGEVEVEITATHTWVGDLTFQLTRVASSTLPLAHQGSASGTLTLLNRPGRSGNGGGPGNSDDLVAETPVRFSDFASSSQSAEALGDPPCGGVIDGSPDCPDNYLPAPDVADTPFPGQGIDFFTTFHGLDSLGEWTLCAGDSAAGDPGTLISWRLFIGHIIPVELQSFSIE